MPNEKHEKTKIRERVAQVKRGSSVECPRLREPLKKLEIIWEREAAPKPNGIPFFYRGVVVAIFCVESPTWSILLKVNCVSQDFSSVGANTK